METKSESGKLFSVIRDKDITVKEKMMDGKHGMRKVIRVEVHGFEVFKLIQWDRDENSVHIEMNMEHADVFHSSVEKFGINTKYMGKREFNKGIGKVRDHKDHDLTEWVITAKRS